ncbi:hypothetical protein K8S19_05135 [bacterium]|nr:hypothetical protein [bacterium]
MKKWYWIVFCSVGFLFAHPVAAHAEINFGGGMEYFTTKAMIDDGANGFCHTMIQSTLIVAKINWLEGPWYVEVNGGISDWNVSGDWDGSGIDPIQMDVIGWAWQQKTEAILSYQFWKSLGVGLRFSDHALEHYDGLTNYRFTRYRKQGYSVMFNWQALRAKDMLIQLDLVYAPNDRLELSHVVPKGEFDYFFYYETAGTGPTWLGKIKLEYRDSAGWGLDLIYQFGWSDFSNPENVEHVTIKTGSLTGYFVLRF